jgi:WD40 repeat protein
MISDKTKWCIGYIKNNDTLKNLSNKECEQLLEEYEVTDVLDELRFNSLVHKPEAQDLMWKFAVAAIMLNKMNQGHMTGGDESFTFNSTEGYNGEFRTEQEDRYEFVKRKNANFDVTSEKTELECTGETQQEVDDCMDERMSRVGDYEEELKTELDQIVNQFVSFTNDVLNRCRANYTRRVNKLHTLNETLDTITKKYKIKNQRDVYVWTCNKRTTEKIIAAENKLKVLLKKLKANLSLQIDCPELDDQIEEIQTKIKNLVENVELDREDEENVYENGVLVGTRNNKANHKHSMTQEFDENGNVVNEQINDVKDTGDYRIADEAKEDPERFMDDWKTNRFKDNTEVDYDIPREGKKYNMNQEDLDGLAHGKTTNNDQGLPKTHELEGPECKGSEMEIGTRRLPMNQPLQNEPRRDTTRDVVRPTPQVRPDIRQSVEVVPQPINRPRSFEQTPEIPGSRDVVNETVSVQPEMRETVQVVPQSINQPQMGQTRVIPESRATLTVECSRDLRYLMEDLEELAEDQMVDESDYNKLTGLMKSLKSDEDTGTVNDRQCARRKHMIRKVYLEIKIKAIKVQIDDIRDEHFDELDEEAKIDHKINETIPIINRLTNEELDYMNFTNDYEEVPIENYSQYDDRIREIIRMYTKIYIHGTKDRIDDQTSTKINTMHKEIRRLTTSFVNDPEIQAKLKSLMALFGYNALEMSTMPGQNLAPRRTEMPSRPAPAAPGTQVRPPLPTHTAPPRPTPVVESDFNQMLLDNDDITDDDDEDEKCLDNDECEDDQRCENGTCVDRVISAPTLPQMPPMQSPTPRPTLPPRPSSHSTAVLPSMPPTLPKKPTVYQDLPHPPRAVMQQPLPETPKRRRGPPPLPGQSGKGDMKEYEIVSMISGKDVTKSKYIIEDENGDRHDVYFKDIHPEETTGVLYELGVLEYDLSAGTQEGGVFDPWNPYSDESDDDDSDVEVILNNPNAPVNQLEDEDDFTYVDDDGVVIPPHVVNNEQHAEVEREIDRIRRLEHREARRVDLNDIKDPRQCGGNDDGDDSDVEIIDDENDHVRTPIPGSNERLITTPQEQFFEAIRTGNANDVRELLQNNQVNPAANDNIAIGVAAGSGYMAIVRLLVADRRVDPFANDNNAINVASEQGHEDVAQYLRAIRRARRDQRPGGLVDQMIERGLMSIVTPEPAHQYNDVYELLDAVNSGNISEVNRLLQPEQIDPSDIENVDHVLIRQAARSGNLAILNALLEYGIGSSVTNEVMMGIIDTTDNEVISERLRQFHLQENGQIQNVSPEEQPVCELLLTLEGHTNNISSARFSPDGSKIVTISRDNTAKVWNVNNGTLLQNLEYSTGDVWSAQFSPDGSKIVTASYDRTAKVWDANTGVLLRTLEGHTNWVNSAEFSPDGSKIVTASNDYTAKVWDANTGDLLHTLEGHTDNVKSAQFSPDGSKIATASEDHTAKVWDANTGEGFRNLYGGASFAQFSPDGSKIVTASEDRTAKVWDAGSGALLHDLEYDTGDVWDAQFSPDGSKIVTASEDGTAMVWDAYNGGDPLLTLEGHTSSVTFAQFSPDGFQIVTASLNHIAKVWDANTGEDLQTLEGYFAEFSPDGSKIVTASRDTAKVWSCIVSQEERLRREEERRRPEEERRRPEEERLQQQRQRTRDRQAQLDANRRRLAQQYRESEEKQQDEHTFVTENRCKNKESWFTTEPHAPDADLVTLYVPGQSDGVCYDRTKLLEWLEVNRVHSHLQNGERANLYKLPMRELTDERSVGHIRDTNHSRYIKETSYKDSGGNTVVNVYPMVDTPPQQGGSNVYYDKRVSKQSKSKHRRLQDIQLMNAVRDQRIDEVKKLLKRGGDVNYYDDRGSLISVAVETNNRTLIDLLLNRGAKHTEQQGGRMTMKPKYEKMKMNIKQPPHKIKMENTTSQVPRVESVKEQKPESMNEMVNNQELMDNYKKTTETLVNKMKNGEDVTKELKNYMSIASIINSGGVYI